MAEPSLKDLYDDAAKDFIDIPGEKDKVDLEMLAHDQTIWSMGYIRGVRHILERFEEMHQCQSGVPWFECDCGFSEAIGDLMEESDIVGLAVDEAVEENFGDGDEKDEKSEPDSKDSADTGEAAGFGA